MPNIHVSTNTTNISTSGAHLNAISTDGFRLNVTNTDAYRATVTNTPALSLNLSAIAGPRGERGIPGPVGTGLSGIFVGDTLLTDAHLTGAGNVTVSHDGSRIYISGDVSEVLVAGNNNAVNLSGKLTETGIALLNSISQLSNRLVQSGIDLMAIIAGAQNGVTAVNGLTGHVRITGAGGITVSQNAGLIVISGLDVSTDQFFTTPVPTGFTEYFVSFPRNFPEIPVILSAVQVTGNVMYGAAIEDPTISGFRAIFTNTIQEPGVTLNIGLHLDR